MNGSKIIKKSNKTSVALWNATPKLTASPVRKEPQQTGLIFSKLLTALLSTWNTYWYQHDDWLNLMSFIWKCRLEKRKFFHVKSWLITYSTVWRVSCARGLSVIKHVWVNKGVCLQYPRNPDEMLFLAKHILEHLSQSSRVFLFDW